MKIILFLRNLNAFLNYSKIAIPLFLLFCLSGCSKKQSTTSTQPQTVNNPPPNEIGNSFSYKKNGVLQPITLLKVAYNPNCLPAYIAVEVENGAGKDVLFLYLPPGITEGTHNFEKVGGILFYYVITEATNYKAKDGVLIIDKHDFTGKKIEGSISLNIFDKATGQKMIAITEGKFKLKY
ncbi:MAG: hypothetical protein IPK62_05485 [Bacteroidetes bacterium]|nr:hypothetical protein [Bacteroidota bacterium]